MNGRDVFRRRRHIEICVRDKIHLIQKRQRRFLKNKRILERLIVPLRHGKHYRLRILAQRKFRRADEVPDVLNDQEIESVGI